MTTEVFKREIWNFEQNKEWAYLGDKPAIIELYATWHPQCKQLSLILDELQKEYGGELLIHRVDVDQQPQLAQLFNASTLPTMVFIHTHQKPFVITGLWPKKQLKEIIDEKLEVKK